MDNQLQEQFAVAIQNLREDLKEHRAETRQDIKDLEAKNGTWQDEVRSEFTDVKKRLTIIETQTATVETQKSIKILKQQTIGGFLLVLVTFIAAGISWYQVSSERHADTVARVEDNRKHMDVTAEEALERAKRSSDSSK